MANDPDKTDTKWVARARSFRDAVAAALVWGRDHPNAGMALTFGAGLLLGIVIGALA